MTAYVIRAGAEHLPLPDVSVDLVCTSPPYFGLRSYQDQGQHYDGQVGSEATPAEFLDVLVRCTAEWMRVLKPSGSIFVNLGDKYSTGIGAPAKSLLSLPSRYANRCVDELGLILRAEIIWEKPNGLPTGGQDRVQRTHENWYHLTREARYYSNIDAIRTAQVAGPTGLRTDQAGAGHHERIKSDRKTQNRSAWAGNPLGAQPRSVWNIAPASLKAPAHLGAEHHATFPLEWPRRIVKAWSPEGGVVLDPFGGSGTTALAASVLGRIGISVDLSHDYSRLARWRTTDRQQLAAAMGVQKPEPVMDGQAELFGESA